jgi:hypothetical protein
MNLDNGGTCTNAKSRICPALDLRRALCVTERSKRNAMSGCMIRTLDKSPKVCCIGRRPWEVAPAHDATILSLG